MAENTAYPGLPEQQPLAQNPAQYQQVPPQQPVQGNPVVGQFYVKRASAIKATENLTYGGYVVLVVACLNLLSSIIFFSTGFGGVVNIPTQDGKSINIDFGNAIYAANGMQIAMVVLLFVQGSSQLKSARLTKNSLELYNPSLPGSQLSATAIYARKTTRIIGSFTICYIVFMAVSLSLEANGFKKAITQAIRDNWGEIQQQFGNQWTEQEVISFYTNIISTSMIIGGIFGALCTIGCCAVCGGLARKVETEMYQAEELSMQIGMAGQNPPQPTYAQQPVYQQPMAPPTMPPQQPPVYQQPYQAPPLNQSVASSHQTPQ